ncbi:cardiolipin synthase [Candidatus Saccharibacteria bacterium]|nr:cardiolipin synthase [Candidatus Saccharibacteria bacterium]
MINAIKRVLIAGIGLFLQFGFAFAVRHYFDEHLGIIMFFYGAISIIIALAILRNSTRLSNDLPWIILILVFPIFGTIFLLMLDRNYSKNKLLRNILHYEKKYKDCFKQDESIKKEVKSKHLDNIQYLIDRTEYIVTKNNKIEYYDFGEKFYPELLKELKKAKEFIFMEYFIINKGVMWDGILEILKEKAKEGVDVRIMYDDMGTIARLSTKYPKELASYGIKCITFNKLIPFRGIFMNNRDHRKITIIDGKTAFSGGVNLSDEYININSKFGVWKDNGIKIEGDAIWNLTVMFLTLWNANTGDDGGIEQYQYNFGKEIEPNGYIVPYGVAPRHEDLVGEDVYINLINSAKEYLYIMTPYLVIDIDMTNSLCRAAKRGVDVRIIIPGIPDKKLVYTQATSFFKILHDCGVKIYKYEKGFMHSKVFLADDVRSVVGTINLDYRSLYLHFENGIYMEEIKEIKEIKKDFDNTFKDCRPISKKETEAGFFKNIWQAILRLFAPLF